MRAVSKEEVVPWVVATVAALFVGSIGVFLVHSGIEIIGTPHWGDADNQPGVYYVMGGFWALLGFMLLVPAGLLIGRFVRLIKARCGHTRSGAA